MVAKRMVILVAVAAALSVLMAQTVFADVVFHQFEPSGSHSYLSEDTVQDYEAYYRVYVNEYIQTVNANKLHWIMTEVRQTVFRGDPVYGYYYIVDSVRGTSKRYDWLFGKHLLDYSLLAFETNWDTLVETNYYPYSQTWHYSVFP